MDLTPRSHATHSPHFRPTTGQPVPINVSSPYSTPPHSHAQTEILSAHSPAGLGILNSSHIPMCSQLQPLLQSTQAWQHGCDSAHPFSPMGVIPNIHLFEQTQLLLRDTQSQSGTSMVYSSPPNHPMSRSTLMQRFAPSYNSSLQYTPVPNTRQQQSPIPQQQQEQVNCSMPQDIGHDAAAFLFELDSNVENQSVEDYSVERPVINNRVPRIPLRSSRSHATAPQSDSGKVQTGGIRKQTRRKAGAAGAKYKCDECGMLFTRNSNCKSHKKIHDPNRKFPHQCSAPQCTKKFSRKTDLVRHEDSVHKKKRDYGCDQCGHYFARSDTLRRHCEDGCRRRHRQAQRTTASQPTVTEHIEAYQSPASLYRDPIATYPETHDQQKYSNSFISPYIDNTATAFPQYL
ncbi:hypothetical protein AJ79_00492 [Helicocarpus griseus UAMH5409]|uniref:C2H2-type domain-containing protein n=1 Tax=Helicocarpus griseus UAMH5409 TaxID=1447875 RepID=A0A2B7YBL8_9EURO|nr:hypothetical protein AJ79_00492 [Helicocarpus griseus UAMH5409]